MPAATFSGKLEIHLMPSTGEPPPIEAGRAMIRDVGRSGKRRKYEGGFTEWPAQCSRYVAATSSMVSLLAPRQRALHLGARDHRERWHGDRPRLRGLGRRGVDGGHPTVTSTVGEQSVRRTGSAIATSTSRGPSNASRLCAERTLSTSSTSPACHGSRAVWAS